MSTIADELNRIKNAKNAIKEAIERNGMYVFDSLKIDNYASLIDSLPMGGGGL